MQVEGANMYLTVQVSGSSGISVQKESQIDEDNSKIAPDGNRSPQHWAFRTRWGQDGWGCQIATIYHRQLAACVLSPRCIRPRPNWRDCAAKKSLA
jgi:hypothetical protein